MQLLDDGQILRIKELRREDEGLYTCEAENSLQRISASTDLRVRDPSKNNSLYILFIKSSSYST